MSEHGASQRTHRALWPLPGGDGRFFATLLEILEWVRDHEQQPLPMLYGWMQQRYGLRQDAHTAESYTRLIVTMGYLAEMRGGVAALTERGQSLLTTRDPNLVVGVLLCEFVGTYDMLNAIARLGVSNAKTLKSALSAHYRSWTSLGQYQWRLGWLNSLGCLQRSQGGYVITPTGREALNTYVDAHPGAGSEPLSKENETTPIPAIPTIPGPVQIVTESTAKPPVLSFLDEADRLAKRVQTAALASDDAEGFERVLVEAFTFLGFSAEHKSGSGDTDVLVIASLGQETYRAVVDGKSSRHGKVGKQQIEWYALERHRALHHADYILVVAPGFSSGDLLDNAEKAHAGLLTADDLGAIIRLHASTPLSLTDLRDLFRYAGHPELPLQRLQEKTAEVARLQMLLPDIVRTFESSYQVGVPGPIAADAIHLILANRYGRAVYTRDEIVAALDLLCAPLIGALRKVTDSAYALQMPMISIGRRLQAQARQLLDAAQGAEAKATDLRGRQTHM